MKYQMSRQGWNHAPQCMLTPEQVQELVPIINIDKVRRLFLFLASLLTQNKLGAKLHEYGNNPILSRYWQDYTHPQMAISTHTL